MGGSAGCLDFSQGLIRQAEIAVSGWLRRTEPSVPARQKGALDEVPK